MGKLRKLKQRILSIESFVEKYYSFLRKNQTADPGLLHLWLVAGLSLGEQQSVTGWAAERELRGEPLPREAVME